MKIAIVIARVLLGGLFVVFGLNAFLNFLPMPEMSGPPKEFMGILYSSGWLHVIKIIEIVGGLALIAGRFVPLGLTLLGPVIVNILLFSIFLKPDNLPMAFVITGLEGFLIYANWDSFKSVFKA